MIRSVKRLCIWAFLIGTLALSGCTVRVAYGFLDNVLSWRAAQYVKFNREQKKRSKKIFKEFHRWHRKTQLTLYADYLEQLRDGIVAGDVSGDYLHKQSDRLQDLVDISVEKLLPGATELIGSLSDEQVEEVLDNLRQEREDYEQQYIKASAKKIQKTRIKDITRYVGGFFGSFTAEQKQRLLTWEQSLSPYDVLMVEQQKMLQQEFADALVNRRDLPALEQQIRPLVILRTDEWDPELERVLDINQELTFAMLADLFNSQTPKQRKKLNAKFDRYISDLNYLASKAK